MKNNQAGVTLVELLIVVVIVAVSASMGVPNLYRYIENQKVRFARESLADVARIARRYALEYNSGDVAGFLGGTSTFGGVSPEAAGELFFELKDKGFLAPNTLASGVFAKGFTYSCDANCLTLIATVTTSGAPGAPRFIKYTVDPVNPTADTICDSLFDAAC